MFNQDRYSLIEDSVNKIKGLELVLKEKDLSLISGSKPWTIKEVLSHLAGLQYEINNGIRNGEDIPEGSSEYFEVINEARRNLSLEELFHEIDIEYSFYLETLENHQDWSMEFPTFGGRKIAVAQMVAARIIDVYVHLLDILWAIDELESYRQNINALKYCGSKMLKGLAQFPEADQKILIELDKEIVFGSNTTDDSIKTDYLNFVLHASGRNHMVDLNKVTIEGNFAKEVWRNISRKL
ncbi:MAG: hypothetical protein EVA28_00150 [Candidatus Actinomarinales bacterium]|nr:MAG: hypothetical protein EVA28_00150 [Candidatus Actinomarinales bacterium]